MHYLITINNIQLLEFQKIVSIFARHKNLLPRDTIFNLKKTINLIAMKKLLLFSALPLCMFNAMAQGTSPETATPIPAGGWFVENLNNAPAEAWFTISNNTEFPVNWGDAPSANEQQIFVYLCDGGQTAFQRIEGSDSYILLPGKEYLVKITPKATGFFCFNAALTLPASWAGKYKYYPIPLKNEWSAWGSQQTIAPGETKWFYADAPYASQLTVQNNMMFVPSIEKVEVIHIECPGGTNTGSSIIPPYFKAGGNVIGVTVSSTATENASFNFGASAMTTLNCNNNLLRGQSLTLDVQNTYPDAYYTVDRFFKVPEDGTYTFINHGAKGTILNVGTVDVDPTNQYKGTCNWDNIKSATVGNNDAVVVVDNLKEGTTVLVQSDAFGIIGEGMENLPYLQVLKGNQAGIDAVDNDDDTLKVAVSGNVLTVSSVLIAAGSEVAVYDMQARKVTSAVSTTGAETLSVSVNAPAGMYMVVVYGKGNSESAKIVIK